PQGYIDPELRKASLIQAEQMKAAFDASSVPAWQPRGPYNIGGRITTMAISQQTPSILYIGAADGGVFKTTNAGVSWQPLFDNQRSLSMGAIAVDPTNDNIVYAGTGEANSSGDSYDGFGVVKSSDGGATWAYVGLEETRHIGKIVIDPTNTQTIYVAGLGTLFTGNLGRGLYKSTNSGATWAKVLFVNDTTGVVDVTINPLNPNILMAAAWQRRRGPQGRLFVGGVGTGIYRSSDAGASWFSLSNGLPAPAANVGRPGIAIAPSNPSIAYAWFADDPGNLLGIFKTTDRGDSWFAVTSGGSTGGFGWYFGNVWVHPTNENIVFTSGVPLARSTNGGTSWATNNTTHVDIHGLAFHPTNPNIIYVGNDGGFGTSTNGGTSWTRYTNQDLAISQFYAGTIDYLNPNSSIGGTQDNGTIRTVAGGLTDWTMVNGGDGFYAVVDYTNSNYQYAESQYGAIVRTSNNWGSVQSGSSGFTGRKNWSTPIVIDPNNPQVLYTGSERLHRTVNRAASWVAISPDLTNGPVPGFSAYATITTIDVSKTDSNTIIVGTDDANVWVTTNLGSTWTNVKAGLPNRWVTRVRFDPTDRNIAYVTMTGYRVDSYLPHIFRTTNLGASWQNISNNLPEAPINVVVVDPQYPNRLYIGTDVGAFYTKNSGQEWSVMGAGLPNVVIDDLALHQPTRIVRAFTHGRSVWQISIDSLVITDVAEQGMQPVRFELAQNYPNPFNPTTEIRFDLPDAGNISLVVYDVLGREVAELASGYREAGYHSATWNASAQASGVYFARFTVTNT
ncbi:MAG: T9SS type A sorting domain-containing protein, partial [Bacteroidota bacterium]